MQDERESKVKEAEKRVRDLEDERQRLDDELKKMMMMMMMMMMMCDDDDDDGRLDDELKKHVERTRRVNIGQEVLEAKMKVPPHLCYILNVTNLLLRLRSKSARLSERQRAE